MKRCPGRIKELPRRSSHSIQVDEDLLTGEKESRRQDFFLRTQLRKDRWGNFSL